MSDKKSIKKVIFLDIDGVLCTARSHMAFGGTKAHGFMQHLDPVGVKLIESLCDETGAEIVISSTWRVYHDYQSMLAIFMNAGMAAPNLHTQWKTRDEKKIRGRGNEIDQWIKDHNFQGSYVIIDDDSDLLEYQKPYWIACNADDGLSWTGYKKALKILLDSSPSKIIDDDRNNPAHYNAVQGMCEEK